MATDQLPLDTTPSVPLQQNFRGGPELERTDDWKNNIREEFEQSLHDTRYETEPLPLNVADFTFRDTDRMDSHDDWRGVSASGTFFSATPVGLEANAVHPDLRAFREDETFDAQWRK